MKLIMTYLKTILLMIVQNRFPCWYCGSWYRKKYGPKYYCNICGHPDKGIADEYKKEPVKWEDRIIEKAKKEECLPEEKKEVLPDAIQMELKF